MKSVHCQSDRRWLEKVVSAIRFEGIAIVEGVFNDDLILTARRAVENAASAIQADLGTERLSAARQSGYGELRLLLKYDPFFLSLLVVPEMLQVVDATLGTKAVLRFQNASILPPHLEGEVSLRTQEFHMNSPRVMPGYLSSLEVVYPLTAMEAEDRDFVVALGTHQRPEPPDSDYLQWAAVPVACPTGGMILFDSTLWHQEGINNTKRDRCMIAQQLTQSFIKPHFDYVRCMGDAQILALPERLRQLLGWYTRLPTSLDEFYLPLAQRFYRSDQG